MNLHIDVLALKINPDTRQAVLKHCQDHVIVLTYLVFVQNFCDRNRF